MKTIRLAALVSCFIWTAAEGALDVAVEEPLAIMQAYAAVGNPPAQFNLAQVYLKGDKVPKDVKLAIEWYKKAANAGLPEAQYNLGVMLANGEGVSRDDKEAAKWFDSAARNGVFEAQTIMMELYTEGRGVEKSPAKALTWDMLARRTLELRHGVPSGEPPKPAKLRADGAAEITGKDGKVIWLHENGDRETLGGDDLVHLEHKDGRKTTVQKDGTRDTVHPDGTTEQITPKGRKTLRDPKGHIVITELDGSRIEEGDGKDSEGKTVHIRDSFDKTGKRISRKIEHDGLVDEERADGTRLVQSKARGDRGESMIVSEEFNAEGKLTDATIKRVSDGVGPKNMERWKVRRTLRVGDGTYVDVIEEYSSVGISSQTQVSRPGARLAQAIPVQTARMAPPNGIEMSTNSVSIPIVVPQMPPRIVRPLGPGTRKSYDDPKAFREKPDLAPMLAKLEKAEFAARNFAGATEADYQRAKAAAAGYFIPLSAPPQKAASAPAWLRQRTLSQTTLHEAPLIPAHDDRSQKFPLGYHGAEVIKQHPWKHAETDHFVVHYLGDAEARLTMQYLECAYTMVTVLFDLDPKRALAKSHVFIFPEAEWRTYLAKTGQPASLAGFAYKTELLARAATDRDDRAKSAHVLSHEVTHAIVSRFYPGHQLPLWLNEGLAEYLAERTLATKRGGRAPDIDKSAPDAPMDVVKVFDRIKYGDETSPDRLAAFYANSEKCVQVLFEKLPVEAFGKFFNSVAAGNEPGAALGAAYGKQCAGIAAFAALVNAR